MFDPRKFNSIDYNEYRMYFYHEKPAFFSTRANITEAPFLNIFKDQYAEFILVREHLQKSRSLFTKINIYKIVDKEDLALPWI